MKTTKGLAARIREYMKKRGITRGEMAERLGVTTRQLDRYLYRQSSPSLAVAVLVAEELGVTVQTVTRLIRVDRRAA